MDIIYSYSLARDPRGCRPRTQRPRMRSWATIIIIIIIIVIIIIVILVIIIIIIIIIRGAARPGRTCRALAERPPRRRGGARHGHAGHRRRRLQGSCSRVCGGFQRAASIISRVFSPQGLKKSQGVLFPLAVVRSGADRLA